MDIDIGDFLIINYTTKVKETNKVIETTSKEVATKEHIFREGINYEPRLLIIGEEELKHLQEELLKLDMELNKVFTIELPPEKAYGVRIPNNVKILRLKQLLRRGIKPVVGMKLTYNEHEVVVRSVNSGRVMIDFNSPLAGKTIIYEVTILKKLESLNDKVLALIHRKTSVIEEDKWKLSIKNKVLTIEIPEESLYIEGFSITKKNIVMDIEKYTDITDVNYIERYKCKKKEDKKNE